MEKNITIPMGEQRIAAVLHIPAHTGDAKHPVVVICHGFIGSKVGQHRIFVKTARELCRAGFAVLRFDYVGCGESTGEYEDVTLQQQIKETIGVLDFVAALPFIDNDAIMLLGHSLGGCIAATVAGLDKRVRKIVLWSPVAQPLADIVGIVGEGIYKACLQDAGVHYQGFALGAGFFHSLAQVFPLENIKDFKGDVMIIHGTSDAETPLENAYAYEAALRDRPRGLQTLKTVDGADHTYNSPLWEWQVIAMTLQWLQYSAAESYAHSRIKLVS